MINGKIGLMTSTFIAAGLYVSAVSAGTVTSEGADIVINTKGGFNARTVDDAFSFKIGGRIQLQYDAYQDAMNLIGDEGSDDGATGSELYFRRARINMGGTVFTDWAYKIGFNLVDEGSGGGRVVDLYMRWQRYDMAKLTFGKHY